VEVGKCLFHSNERAERLIRSRSASAKEKSVNIGRTRGNLHVGKEGSWGLLNIARKKGNDETLPVAVCLGHSSRFGRKEGKRNSCLMKSGTKSAQAQQSKTLSPIEKQASGTRKGNRVGSLQAAGNGPDSQGAYRTVSAEEKSPNGCG